MALVIPVVLLLATTACVANRDTWVQCTFKTVSVLKPSNVARQTKQVKSLLQCSMLASNREWPQVISYSTNGTLVAPECTLWGHGSISGGDVVRESAPGPPTCMTMIPESRAYLPSPQRPKPFYMSSLGCILVDIIKRNWTDSRLACQALGGDLFVAKDVDQLIGLRDHLLNNYGNSYGSVWAGMMRTPQGIWQWFSRRVVNDLIECQTCGSAHFCAVSVRHWGYKFSSILCPSLHPHICRRG